MARGRPWLRSGWSRGALGDLDHIGRFLERGSPRYARTVVARLFESADVLAAHPNLGRRVTEVDLDHIREVIRDGYRVVYLVADDGVEVLAVLHGRQDLGKKLRRE